MRCTANGRRFLASLSLPCRQLTVWELAVTLDASMASLTSVGCVEKRIEASSMTSPVFFGISQPPLYSSPAHSFSLSFITNQNTTTGSRRAGQRALLGETSRPGHGLRRARRGRDAPRHDRQGRARQLGVRPGHWRLGGRGGGQPRGDFGRVGGLQGPDPGEQPAARPAGEAAARGGGGEEEVGGGEGLLFFHFLLSFVC